MSDNNTDLPIEYFEMWARVDLMGHNQLAGKLSVVNTGVEVLYRLDIPDGQGFRTKYFGKGSTYSIEPVTEDACRLIAEKLGTQAPISAWDLPEEWREAMRAAKAKALPAPTEHAAMPVYELRDEEPGDDFEDDDEDFDDREEREDDGSVTRDNGERDDEHGNAPGY